MCVGLCVSKHAAFPKCVEAAVSRDSTRGLRQINPPLENLPGDTSHPAITHKTRRCFLKCQHPGTQEPCTPKLGWPVVLPGGTGTASGHLRLSNLTCLPKRTQTQKTSAKRPSEHVANDYNLGPAGTEQMHGVLIQYTQNRLDIPSCFLFKFPRWH